MLIAFCATFSTLAINRASGQGSAQSGQTDAPDSCAIWGQLIVPGRSSEEPVFVEIVGRAGVPSQKVQVINGNFRFKFVPPESYQFRVFDQSGHVMYKEVKAVRGTNDHIIIATRQVPSAGSKSAVVSLAALKHKTPRKALDEFEAGAKAAESGDAQKGIEHWISALKIDPQFSEARINLAVQYGKMGRHQEALQEGQTAYELNPKNREVGYRYAMMLLANKHYRECETIARSVIRDQWYIAQMKTALAVSLIGQKRDFAEAFRNIREAAEDFPIARLLAAETLAEIGWRESAINQIRTYLNSSANPCERARLEAMIAEYSHMAGSDEGMESLP